MLIIAGSLRFGPAAHDDVLARLTEITVTSLGDPGCVDYWWAEDIDEPNTFRFFECWESQADFDAHVGTPEERAFGARNRARPRGATAQIYEASPTS